MRARHIAKPKGWRLWELVDQPIFHRTMITKPYKAYPVCGRGERIPTFRLDGLCCNDRGCGRSGEAFGCEPYDRIGGCDYP